MKYVWLFAANSFRLSFYKVNNVCVNTSQLGIQVDSNSLFTLVFLLAFSLWGENSTYTRRACDILASICRRGEIALTRRHRGL